MSRDHDIDLAPLRDAAQLAEYFAAGAKPEAERGIGTEHEKFGFDRASGRPLPFDGAKGIEALLLRLADQGGGSPILDAGRCIGVQLDGATVTLEPGGQLELSGRVTRTAVETRDEIRDHLRDVQRIGAELDQRWCFFGMTPWAGLDDVPWMPKSRYRVMRPYLERQGSDAHWMMKMTCTVQANLDFRSERDAMAMLGLVARLNPLVTAIWAASPSRQGVQRGMVSERMEVWQHTDPQRCGTPAFMLDDEAGFERYVEWLLDIPMFFIRRDGAYVDWSGRSFRTHLRGGYGVTPVLGDWELHLSTAFPDVRLKRFIETRTADCGPPPMLWALTAFWRGILYDDGARDRARSIVDVESPARLAALALESRGLGLAGTHDGRRIRDLATEVIEVARRGLASQPGGTADAALLDALLDHRGEATSPAERLGAELRTLPVAEVQERYAIEAWL
jgi:glutamate--cysteine ligase